MVKAVGLAIKTTPKRRSVENLVKPLNRSNFC
jgi:hypothetical protein